MFNNYNKLGFFNPFYEVDSSEKKFYTSPKSLLDTKKQYTLDNATLIEMLSRGFCFGDRTILKEIKKTPWLAKPNPMSDDWYLEKLPSHGMKEINSYKEVGDELFRLLKNELIELVGTKKSIGILLSGGMDSRITAGALYECLKENSISANVIAITWGISNSRDVIYSSLIAKQFKWDWKHYTISPENLYENITITADYLCEFSPYNLHAMPQVSKMTGVDCILASSYGDSIGRGVFSSRHLLQLTPYHSYLRNWFGLIEKKTFKKHKNSCLSDLNETEIKYKREYKHQSLEIERLSHYMRRLLNPCMNIINEKTPLYQTFSSLEIVNYMWQFDAKYRTNEVYKSIFKENLAHLNHIPWSKTGKPFSDIEDVPADNYSKEYHKYGKWLKNDLYDYVYSLCMSDRIAKLGVVNMEALDRLIKVNKKLNSDAITQIDMFTSWLASLSIFIEQNNVVSTPLNDAFSNKFFSEFEFMLVNSALVLRSKLK